LARPPVVGASPEPSLVERLDPETGRRTYGIERALELIDHSLEAGLQIVSKETGGFYARTHLFPDIALRRLAGALAGYYVLFVEKPESQRSVHDVETELTRRKGRVLATTSFSERDH
jgi:hypothetical protein